MMAKHKMLPSWARQYGKTITVGILLASMIISPFAFAQDPSKPKNGSSGGGGSAGGDTGSAGFTSSVRWAANDNFGPVDTNTVVNVIRSNDSVVENSAMGNITQATTNALADCVANYNQRHPGSQANCRVFAVGWVRTDQDKTSAQATGGLTEAQWRTSYAQSVAQNDYRHNGTSYRTNDVFADGVTSIDSIAARETAGGNKSVVVIALAQDQPRTWEFKPNKAWIKFDEATNKWVTVADPQGSNTVGADTATILDGAKVGAVVNGIVAANLGQALNTFGLFDDMAAADYLFDLDPADIRVYAKPIGDESTPDAADMVNTGVDVTSQFTVKVERGNFVGVIMKEADRVNLSHSQQSMQYSLVIGGKANYAHGAGAAQVRKDAGVGESEPVTFCTTPQPGIDLVNTHGFVNKAWQTVGARSKPTNEPFICGYVPPVEKKVLGNVSEGGDHSSIDGLKVSQGQKVDYTLTVAPQLPSTVSDTVKALHVTDTYSEYVTIDENSLTITDLATGGVLRQGKDYTLSFAPAQHQFDIIFSAELISAKFANGASPRFLVTFTAKVNDDAPLEKNIDNTYSLRINNSLTPSNTVSNPPVPPVNPHKDVTVKVGGESANEMSVYMSHQFLYQLDSSKLTDRRAYPKITSWRIRDDYNEEFDQPTGKWAVYATDDIKDSTGRIVFANGSKIADNDNPQYFTFEDVNGVFTVSATGALLDLVSHTSTPASWRAYVQVTRLKPSDRVENTFIETVNNTDRESNMVWTKTPDTTPSIQLIKYDKASGLTEGDRNRPEEALKNTKNGETIVFRITNTGKVPLAKLTLTDSTIAGTGTVVDIKFPDNWDTLVLQPGEFVEVEGTLQNMTGSTHTDRGTVTGKPIVECPVVDENPFDDQPGTRADGTCYDTELTASDDWNATRPLAQTGANVSMIALCGVLTALAGAGVALLRRVKSAQ